MQVASNLTVLKAASCSNIPSNTAVAGKQSIQNKVSDTSEITAYHLIVKDSENLLKIKGAWTLSVQEEGLNNVYIWRLIKKT